MGRLRHRQQLLVRHTQAGLTCDVATDDGDTSLLTEGQDALNEAVGHLLEVLIRPRAVQDL